MPDETNTSVSTETSRRRRNLKTAKRDDAGFSTEALPHLSAQQTKWIATRATTENNQLACDLTDIPPDDVLRWMENPDFLVLYQEVMDNKREGFKQLATQLLPQVLLALQEMLTSGNAKAMKDAAVLLLRNQGLLIDKINTVDKDALATLIEEIRRPRPILKTLPNPKEYIDGTAQEV